MKISHIVVMIIRLFSIGLAIFGLEKLIFSISFYLVNDYFSMVSIAFNISIILMAALLWFFPYTTAKILTGYSSFEQETVPSVSAGQISSILFIALGAYLLFNVVSDAGYWIYLTQNGKGLEATFSLSVENRASIFATCLEAIFVICLFLGRKGLFKILTKLRQ